MILEKKYVDFIRIGSLIYSGDTLIGRYRHNILLDLDDTFVFWRRTVNRINEFTNLYLEEDF